MSPRAPRPGASERPRAWRPRRFADPARVAGDPQATASWRCVGAARACRPGSRRVPSPPEPTAGRVHARTGRCVYVGGLQRARRQLRQVRVDVHRHGEDRRGAPAVRVNPSPPGGAPRAAEPIRGRLLEGRTSTPGQATVYTMVTVRSEPSEP